PRRRTTHNPTRADAQPTTRPAADAQPAAHRFNVEPLALRSRAMIARTLTALAAVLSLGLLGACEPSGGDGAPAAAAGSVTIGSNPAGTHVYAVAAGFAKVVQERTGMRATMRPYAGSSVYLPMLQRGEIAFGLNTGIDSYLAYRGLPPYSEPMDRLRAVGVAFPLPIMYMVRADSGLT